MRKRIKEIIPVLIVVALLAPLIIYIVAAYASSFSSSVIMSAGSMEPAVPVGSIIFVKTVDPDDVKVGDIIAFQRSDSRILHRVIDKIVENDSFYFRTKGDANEDPDPWGVRPEQIRGGLFLTIPYYGYLINFAATPVGFALMVLVAILLIANMVRKNIKRHKTGCHISNPL